MYSHKRALWSVQPRPERKSSSKEVLLTLFVEPGELRRARKRAKHSSRRGLPCTDMEMCDYDLDLVRNGGVG